MSRHTYPAPCIASDLLRASAGFAICSAPLLIADSPLPVSTMVLAALSVFFALSFVRALILVRTCIEWDDRAVCSHGLRLRRLYWQNVSSLRLSYYSTRRDRSNGWLQLSLAGDGGRLTVDSRLNGFEELVGRAMQAALTNKLCLDPTTRYNFQALGIAADRLGELETAR